MNFVVLAILLLQLSYCLGDDYVVATKGGRVKGRIRKDRKGGDFYSFQSIPYAKPPLDELRFKAPEPAVPWDGILDGRQDLPKCYQRMDVISGQEDCLYLNVYSKKIISNKSSDELLPVMVYIHGGGNKQGSAEETELGPQHLLTEDIVLVVMNYRLGVFGSLSFEDQTSGIPGNAGLKDQVLALKWVQGNIAKFGGNPNSVTIFGESAGASSVHLHILSPMSKGLFHKAIIQSGTAISLWNYGILGTGKLLAQALNITGDDTKEVIRRLKNVPTEKIFEAQEKFYKPPEINAGWESSPVVEKQANEPAFLPDDPKTILESGNYTHVPFVIGYTSSEALILYAILEMVGKKRVSIDLRESIPYDLNITDDSDAAREIEEKIKTHFFGGRTPNKEDVAENVRLISSAFFIYPTYESISRHLKSSTHPIYLYKFSADTKLNFYKKLDAETAKLPGASHADELSYLFKNNYAHASAVERNSTEERCVERMVELWTNFAKFGNPTPQLTPRIDSLWYPVTKEKYTYLDIGTQGLKTGVDPDEGDRKFWENIYGSYSHT